MLLLFTILFVGLRSLLAGDETLVCGCKRLSASEERELWRVVRVDWMSRAVEDIPLCC